MKLRIDATKCQAYGVCAELAPHLFEPDEWGYAQPTDAAELAADDVGLAERAVRECPAQAISLPD